MKHPSKAQPVVTPVSAAKTALVIIPLLFLVSGCVSKSTYDRDVERLTKQLQIERGERGLSMNTLESQMADKNKTLSDLTNRYIRLQTERTRIIERLNSFRGDIEELQRDVSELKLVVGKNVEKFPSTTANELLIKLIDMEYRVKELLRKEAEDATPVEEITGKKAPAEPQNAAPSGQTPGAEAR